MKAFLITFALSTAAIFAMNAHLDVSGLDTYDRIAELTGRQGPSDLIVWDQLFDQRAWLKARILSDPRCPDLLVLGTSTLGGLSQDLLPSHTLLNGWLTGATIEDYEAVTEIFSQKGCFPREILLGVDPWLFNVKMKEDRWMSLLDEELKFRALPAFPFRFLYVARKRWAVFKERFNFETTLESVRRLFKKAESERGSVPEMVRMEPDAFCRTISEEYYIRSFDGHFTSCPQFFASQERVAEIARGYVLNNTHQMAEWDKLDSDSKKRFAHLVRKWSEAGIRVRMVTPPYHPETYRRLEASPRIKANLTAVDALLTSISSLKGVKFSNFRDPASIGCLPSEYSDSHHFRKGCFEKLVSSIFSPGEAR